QKYFVRDGLRFHLSALLRLDVHALQWSMTLAHTFVSVHLHVSSAQDVRPGPFCVAPPFRAASAQLYAYGKTNIRPGCSSRASIASEGSLLNSAGIFSPRRRIHLLEE